MRWRAAGLTWLGVLVWLLLGCSRPSVESLGPPWKLQVLRLGQLVKELDRSALQQLATPENVTVFDPYYARQKRFVALPLEPILEAALAEPLAAVAARPTAHGFLDELAARDSIECGARRARRNAQGRAAETGAGRRHHRHHGYLRR